MKNTWRQYLKQQRALISTERKQEASLKLLSVLLPQLAHHALILSFASLPEEINTYALNQILASQGRLLLPKIHHDHLKMYHVPDTSRLVQGPFGLLEPDASCVEAIPSLILVPALGFDHLLNRLGYGGGYYDKLLTQFPNLPKFGLGFLEQKTPQLPVQEHDIRMTSVYLV